MKLILCLKCHDVIKGDYETRTCKCGLSGIKYSDDGYNANYWGPAIPLGFNNFSLRKAISKQPAKGMGECFDAFVIPKSCPTYIKLDNCR